MLLTTIVIYLGIFCMLPSVISILFNLHKDCNSMKQVLWYHIYLSLVFKSGMADYKAHTFKHSLCKMYFYITNTCLLWAKVCNKCFFNISSISNVLSLICMWDNNNEVLTKVCVCWIYTFYSHQPIVVTQIFQREWGSVEQRLFVTFLEKLYRE